MRSRFLSRIGRLSFFAAVLFFAAVASASATATTVHLIEIGRQEHKGIVVRTFDVSGLPLAPDSRAKLLVLPRVIRALLCRGSGKSAHCIETGTSVPFARRPEPYADPAFELFPSDQDPAQRTLTVWARSDMPFAYVVESRDEYVNRLLLARTIDAAFLGALFAVLFFSVVALVELRTPSSFFFIGYVCSLFVVEFVATGIGMQYIWPQLALDRTLLVLIASELGFVMYFLFARSFVALERRFPRLNQVAIIALALQVTLATVEYLFPSTAFRGIVVAAEFFTLAVLGFAAIALVGTPGVSRLYAISFFPAMLGAGASVWYEAFGLGRGSIFAWKGIELGTSIQCLAISVSVLDRLRTLREERQEMAQELAVTELENAELERIAATDALSGLPNRSAFFEALRRELIEGQVAALLYLDLDRFKPVNDRFGHAVGDQVLHIVADRLRRAVRTGDLVARLGGDEFAVAVIGDSESDVHSIVETVRSAIQRPMRVGTVTTSVGVSIGIARARGENADALVDAADRHMYEDKIARSAKGNV